MRIKAVISELDEREWELVQSTATTAYDFAPSGTRVCVVLTHGELEHHTEMPMGPFIGLIKSLALAKAFRIMGSAVAALRPDALPDVLVRKNCAFCGRERTAKDDNHADDCAYWSIGPGSLRTGSDS